MTSLAPVRRFLPVLCAALLAGSLSACGITLKTEPAQQASTRNLKTGDGAKATSDGAPSYKHPTAEGTPEEGLRLARLLRDQGRLEAAAGVYARLDERGALTPLQLLEYASVAAHVQNAGDSLALFGRARRALTAANVTLPTAGAITLANGLGRAAMGVGQLDMALDEFNRVLTLDAGNLVALNAKGVLIDARGQHAEARALFKQAIEHDPADFRAVNNLALSHLASGDNKAAIRLLEQADGAQRPSLSLNLALAYALNGDDRQARRVLGQIVSTQQAQRLLDDFDARRERIRAGATVSNELLAAGRNVLALQAPDKRDRAND